jgi:hypothetical protein
MPDSRASPNYSVTNQKSLCPYQPVRTTQWPTKSLFVPTSQSGLLSDQSKVFLSLPVSPDYSVTNQKSLYPYQPVRTTQWPKVSLSLPASHRAFCSLKWQNCLNLTQLLLVGRINVVRPMNIGCDAAFRVLRRQVWRTFSLFERYAVTRGFD